MERTETTISALTKSCVSKFKELIVQPHSRQIELESRLADFNLWADGVGALSGVGSSLDSRLQGRVNDTHLVKNVLGVLADSLDYYRGVTQIEASGDEGIKNIDSAIENLALIGVAIRRTGKASRNRRADQTFNPDGYPEFRAHLQCIVRLRPTAEGLFHSTETGGYVARLDATEPTPLQNRLIDANLRRRHKFCVAQRRSKHQKQENALSSTLEFPQFPLASSDNPLQGGPPPNSQSAISRQSLYATDSQRPAPTISGFTLASTVEGTIQYMPTASRNNPGAAKTQITSIAADTEFPKPPSIPVARQIAVCPCCCQSLPFETFTNPQRWKQHLTEDLCPYTCIADGCPTPQLLFCTRSEWESHFKQSHLPRWQCPFCEEDADFPTMESMGSHIETEHSHELLENSMPTLLSWSAVQTMGIKSCPLCTSRGPEDSPELVDHVLKHAYEFALRALPWPAPAAHDLNILPGSFNLPENPEYAEDIRRWVNTAPHDQAKVPSLELSDFDRASHSTTVSASLLEYTDHFHMNGYFRETPGDRSSGPPADRSLASRCQTISAHSDGTNSASVSTGSDNIEGLEHPVSLTHMTELASKHLDQNRWKEAESLLIQVIKRKRTVLGPEHPDTLTSIGYLATIYQSQGLLKEAESLLTKVIETQNKVPGPEHPHTLTSMADLAWTYCKQGRWKEAESLLLQVAKTKKTVLGPEHPDTLTSMGNLAITYQSQGLLKEAESLLLEVMDTQNTVLGPEHPHTLISMSNLAYIWKQHGRDANAFHLMERCIRIRRRVLGSDHPDILPSLSDFNDWRQPAFAVPTKPPYSLRRALRMPFIR